MRGLLLALLLAVPAGAQQLYPAGWNPVLVADWGGLNVLLDSTEIGVDAQVARNVLTDGGYLEKRPGNTLLTTILSGYGVKYVGDWVAPSGTRYLIAHASNTVYRTDFSAAPVALGSVTANRNLSSVASFSRVYFADGSKPFWYWDGTSTGTVTDAASGTAAPHCTYLAVKDTRIFCANIPNEGTSRVRISSAGGAGYWFVPSDVGSVDNTPNVFDFTPDDGDLVNCVAATPWGVYVGKKYSSHIIKGTGNLTYEPRLLDPKVGCVDNRSVQMVNGVLQWLSVDGVYGFDGAGPPRIISRELDPIMRGLNFADATAREWVVDTADQWDDGNLTAAGAGAPMSASLITGNILPSSATLTDTTTGMFNLGTFAGAGISGTTISTRGDVTYAGVTSTYTFRYEANVVPNSDGWTWNGAGNQSVSGGSLTVNATACGPGTAYRSYRAMVGTGQPHVSKFMVFRAAANAQTGSNTLYDIGFGDSTGGECDAVRFIDDTIQYGGLVIPSEAYTANTYSTFTIIVSSEPIDSGGSISYWRNGVFKGSMTFLCSAGDLYATIGACTTGSGAGTGVFIDFLHTSTGVPNPGISNIVNVATFTSRIYDTGFSTPTAGILSVTSFTAPGTAIAYTMRSSTSPNNDLWTSTFSVKEGSKPGNYLYRYVQYITTFSHVNLIEAPGFTSAILPTATTGYYNSAVHFIGSNITAYDSFNVIESEPNGSTITYSVRATTYSFNDVTGVNIPWTAQTPNQSITLSVSTPTYYQFRALLDFNQPVNAPMLSRAQTSWNEGSNRAVASGINDRRYFLCVAVSTASTAPDTCFVRQKNSKWVAWDGPSIGAMGLYNNNLVVGDGSTGSKVWEIMQPDVYTDDGEAIDSEWVTADYTNGAVFNEKVLREFWIDAEAVAGSSLTVSYNVNKSSSYIDKTIYLDNGRSINTAAYPQGLMQHGSINAWVPLAAGYATGKYARLRFTNAINNAYFRLNGYLLYLENKARTVPPNPGNSTP